MGTKTFVGIAACCAFFVSSAIAQESTSPASSHSPLNETLYRSVCGRVQAPMVFSTRDTVFALSLPMDEPAEVYVKLTVGKNGKVKEKETRVHANHIAGYVAPAFLAATKELRIDKSLLAGMEGKDTSLLLTFPLEYQCVYDTINKEWPDMTPRPWWTPGLSPLTIQNGGGEAALQKDLREEGTISMSSGAWSDYRNTKPTRVWYYLAFIKGNQEYGKVINIPL